MNKILGILALFCVICIVTGYNNASFMSPYNLENLTQRAALYSIISVGAAFVIVTGGIDLSIGSVIGLIGTLLPYLLVEKGLSVPVAILAVLAVSLAIGVLHGLLITKMNLQPFVVTLCGLLVYRGIARWLTDDSNQGFGDAYGDADGGLRFLAVGKIAIPGYEDPKLFQIPMPVFFALGVMIVSWILLNKTTYGRYMLALGRNESATRLSGIKTDRYKMLAYVICSFLAGVGGILFALNVNTIQPSGHGNFYELYAIAAAVLGGCSLRGGEGTIIGTVIGAAVMRVLYNSILLLGIPTQLEFAIIGIVILLGAIADETFHRLAELNRMRKKRKSQGTG